LRYKEDLTQIELTKKLNISQTNLSAMENGRRSVGKELAKRIAVLLGLDYRIFYNS
jgi:transcriptional regulator with XRE-family HTH domain